MSRIENVYSGIKISLLMLIILFILVSPIIAIILSNRTTLTIVDSFQILGTMGSLILTLLLALLYRGLVNVQKDQTELLEKQQKIAEVNTTPVLNILEVDADENSPILLKIKNSGQGTANRIAGSIRYGTIVDPNSHDNGKYQLPVSSEHSFESTAENTMLTGIQPSKSASADTNSIDPQDPAQQYEFQSVFRYPPNSSEHRLYDGFVNNIASECDLLAIQVTLRYSSIPPLEKSYEAHSTVFVGEVTQEQSLQEFLDKSYKMVNLYQGWDEHGFEVPGNHEEIILPINQKEDSLIDRVLDFLSDMFRSPPL